MEDKRRQELLKKSILLLNATNKEQLEQFINYLHNIIYIE